MFDEKYIYEEQGELTYDLDDNEKSQIIQQFALDKKLVFKGKFTRTFGSKRCMCPCYVFENYAKEEVYFLAEGMWIGCPRMSTIKRVFNTFDMPTPYNKDVDIFSGTKTDELCREIHFKHINLKDGTL